MTTPHLGVPTRAPVTVEDLSLWEGPALAYFIDNYRSNPDYDSLSNLNPLEEYSFTHLRNVLAWRIDIAKEVQPVSRTVMVYGNHMEPSTVFDYLIVKNIIRLCGVSGQGWQDLDYTYRFLEMLSDDKSLSVSAETVWLWWRKGITFELLDTVANIFETKSPVDICDLVYKWGQKQSLFELGTVAQAGFSFNKINQMIKTGVVPDIAVIGTVGEIR